MTKLTKTQLILLTTASQREDYSLLPPPDGIGATGKRFRTSVAALLKQGHAEEVEVTVEGQHWRQQDDRLVGLRITDVGRRAVELEAPHGETAVPPAQEKPASGNNAPRLPALTARAGTKQALILDLLKRDTGASITDLAEATGWLPHTTRAALTGLRKRGCTTAGDLNSHDWDGRSSTTQWISNSGWKCGSAAPPVRIQPGSDCPGRLTAARRSRRVLWGEVMHPKGTAQAKCPWTSGERRFHR